MDETMILGLVKARLGFSSTVRDTYLQARIKGVISELEGEKGLVLNSANYDHIMFIVDYVVWAYENKNDSGEMPRYLKYKLHNLLIKKAGTVI